MHAYVRTVSDVDDSVENVVRGGRIGYLRDAESAERSMEKMRSHSHDDLLGLRGSSFVAAVDGGVGNVDNVLDGADDSLVETFRSARSLFDAVTGNFLQPVLQLLKPASYSSSSGTSSKKKDERACVRKCRRA